MRDFQDAIKRMHGVSSKYVESVPVRIITDQQPVWDGIVEVFDLIRHPNAKRCFAWLCPTGKTEFESVLELGPIDSPRAAVQIALSDSSCLKTC